MKVRVLKMVLTTFMAIGILSGCSSANDVPDDYASNEGYSIAEESAKKDDDVQVQQTSKENVKDNIKVAVLYLSDPAEGSGYSYTHDLGIQGMQTNLGLSSEQIVRKVVDDSDSDATRKAIEECIQDGCNIIFATSWGYMETVAQMAEEYPDIYFSHGTGNMSNGKNFNNYFGRIYQARYLSGIVAGMKTQSNMIGYVAAQDSSNSEVTGGIDAFALGVESVNADAKVYVAVTNSWYDPEKEEEKSRMLLDMGCDVMTQHCDTPYPQTLAQEYGVYGIGYNSDMSKETPDACLTSVIWNWSAYYTSAVKSIINGTWDGSNYFGGMQEGLVQITRLADFCAEGTQEKVDEATQAILSGNFNVFDGVMETNTGEKIGVEGGTLDDATITGGINWYYRNVIVVE
ncbi:MAG: BMP family ABC transporter substrate-binding protein [Lachnospiraceae bacterium]|nr:BMP family ABC transporter substrate-binding protein [Lachnospiraceae bacterium]